MRTKRIIKTILIVIVTIIFLVSILFVPSVSAKTSNSNSLLVTFDKDYPEHYRELLQNDKQKNLYDEMKIKIMEHKDTLDLNDTLSKDDIKNIYASILMDHPEYYYIKDNISFNWSSYLGFDVKYVMFKYKNIDQRLDPDYKAMMNSSIALISGLSDQYKSTDLAKYQIVESYFKHNVDIEKSAGSDAYAAIAKNLTNELGYCRGFSFMLKYSGIDNILVNGKLNGEDRIWLQVNLSGKYYNCDIINNKNEDSKVEFLTNDEMLKLGYEFNVSNYKDSSNNMYVHEISGTSENTKSLNSIYLGNHYINFETNDELKQIILTID